MVIRGAVSEAESVCVCVCVCRVVICGAVSGPCVFVCMCREWSVVGLLG